MELKKKKKISGNMTSVLSLVRPARRVAIAKSDYFIYSQPDGLCIMQKCETRRALDSSREGGRKDEAKFRDQHACTRLFARAKLPDTHRRMRNDEKHGNVWRGKCVVPRASNRPCILVREKRGMTYIA